MVTSRLPALFQYTFSSDHVEDRAIFLQEEAEKALLQGDQKGLDLLEKAAELHPHSPHLYYRQGVALFEYGCYQNTIAPLRKGAQKFKQATDLSPQLCEAWHMRAISHFLIASLNGGQHELIEAKNKIEKAVVLAPPPLAAEIHWDAALIYQKLAEFSQEIDDLSHAIAHFEKSAALEEIHLDEFWTCWGKAYATLSEKVQDIRPVTQSIACYKKALSMARDSSDNLKPVEQEARVHAIPSSSKVSIPQLSILLPKNAPLSLRTSEEGWLGLARSLRKLYHFSQGSDHYQQACDCYTVASQLRKDGVAWLECIEFMIEVSGQKRDISNLQSALERCEKAHLVFQSTLESSSVWHAHLMAYWAEALALLGEWTDRIELIREAQKKIDQAYTQAEPEDLFLISQHGKCLFYFAKYYHDLDLYYQAIEEFQSSLSLDRTQLTCWVWMGISFAQVYEHTEDLNALENALYFFSKALQIKNDPCYYYEVAKLLTQMVEASHTPDSLDEALSYLEHLLFNYASIAYDHPEWFYQYGRSLDLQGTLRDDSSYHQRALEAYINALMLSPNYPKIHHHIGIAYYNLGSALDNSVYFYRALHHFKLAWKTQLEDTSLLMDWGVTWIHLSQSATDLSTEEHCFREAEQKLIQAATLGSESAYYPLATLYSLKGLLPVSLAYLHKSYQATNLPSIDELMEDDWLEAVRLHPSFQDFLALLQKR